MFLVNIEFIILRFLLKNKVGILLWRNVILGKVGMLNIVLRWRIKLIVRINLNKN